MTLPRAVALGLSYLIGSFPTAFILVQCLKGADIRTIGSGNVGATNATRAAGPKAGAVVFLLDALKGVLAVKAVAPHWFPGDSTAALLCGAAAVIGHIAPVWLGFKGGKGVATALGVLSSATPFVAIICFISWLAIFLSSRYVSLASIIAIALMPVGLWLTRQPRSHILIGAGLAALILFKHRTNILRLLNGTEDRRALKKP